MKKDQIRMKVGKAVMIINHSPLLTPNNITNVNKLNVLYYNLNGLTLIKLNKLETLLAANNLDIIIISEHWFPKGFDFSQSRFYIASTSRPSVVRMSGHQNGGILMLGTPRVRTVLQNVTVGEFHIEFRINCQIFNAVYFPPRLTEELIQGELDQMTLPCTLFGDMNFRSKVLGDHLNSNLSRMELIQSIATSRGMTFQRTRNSTNCHHVLANQNTEWTYVKDNFPFYSDHGRMNFSIRLEQETLAPAYCERFILSSIRLPIVKARLVGYFEQAMHPTLSRLLNKAQTYLEESTIDHQALMDSVYNSFMDQIRNMCNSFFPKKAELTRFRVDKNDTVLSTNETIRKVKNSFKQHTCFIQSRSPMLAPVQDCLEYFEQLFRMNPDDGTSNVISNNVFQKRFFSLKDIQGHISRYSSHKTGGVDGFDVRLFKVLSESELFLRDLHLLFGLFLSSVTPTQWNESLIHLIPKRNNQQLFVTDARPISLTQILRRIFEKCLLAEFQAQSWSKSSNYQAGFKSGYSSISQVLLTHEQLQKKSKFAIFLDLKAAYDRISHSKLRSVLLSRGCPQSDLRMIESLMFNNLQSSVCVNGVRSSNFGRYKGLFQGSILSPLLFNIFIDTLAVQLNGRREGSCLLFADDVNLLADNVKEAQEDLDICNAWAYEMDMEWNLDKSGVVCSVEVNLVLDQKVLKQVGSYKYLGFPVNHQGIEFKPHLQHLVTSQQKTFNQLKRIPFSENSKLITYKTFIRPRGEFGLALISQSNLDFKAFKELQDEIVIWILGQNRQVEYSILGLGKFEFRLEILKAGLSKHLNECHLDNPISILRRNQNWGHYLGNSRSIIRQSFYHPWYSEYNKYAARKDDPIKFRTYIANKFSSFHRDWGALHQYIRVRKVDPCLLIKDSQLRRMALQWRRNIWCLGKGRCSRCGKQLNRGCVNLCFGQYFETIMSDQEELDFRMEEAAVHVCNRRANYTRVDYLLNQGKFQEFKFVVTQIAEQLD